MTERTIRGGFGLYVHWPFCQSKCPYCDFNSHVVSRVDQTRWRDALVSEIERYARIVPDRILETVFFGGGTPSLMDPDTTFAVIDAARKAWPTVNDIEITLEANPTSVEAAKFRAFRQTGVNRVSMGIQALNDRDLRALGRMHTAAEARHAFDIARDIFDRVSFDLIYARQDQDRRAWEAELKSALELAVDHLSLYQLTIEDGTVFSSRHRLGQLRGLPQDDTAADMYNTTQEICEAAGLSHYETSNHARIGAESRHNLIYWNCGDYVGIGPGAHGRITTGDGRMATEAALQPGAWLDRAEDATRQTDTSTRLSIDDQFTEFVMMGLRLKDGIPLDRLGDFAGLSLSATGTDDLVSGGWLEQTETHLRVTPAGRPLLDAILRQLML